MKKFLFYTLMLVGFFIKAQDKVYFLDGSSREGKVTEITGEYIILESPDNTDTLPRNHLLLLAFKNGRTEILNKPKETLIYNPFSRANTEEKIQNVKDFENRNFLSVNTLALCNADVSVFYEHLAPGKKIGLGLMGAYNFNPYATFPNLFIAVLDHAKKKYDLGAFLNLYAGGLRKKTTFYYGILFKYTSFSFTSVIEENVTVGSLVSTNIKYHPSTGSQLATLFTCGTHTLIRKTFFIRSLFGLGGFNMRGDYKQQYNYFLTKASRSPSNPSPATYNQKFLLKLYVGLNLGFTF